MTWNGPTFAVVPTGWLPLTVVVNTSLLGGAGVTVNEVAAGVTAVWVVSVAVIVYEPGLLICRLLKVATPLDAVAETVFPPVEKLPPARVSLMVSVEPVLPVVIALPNWSSTVTPTPKAVPAAKLDAGAARDGEFVLRCRIDGLGLKARLEARRGGRNDR